MSEHSSDWQNRIPWELVSRLSAEYEFDPKLIGAMIMQESGGNPFKVRYEPTYSYLYFPRQMAEKRGLSLETMTVCQKMSWGLMQVMGAVAIERGFQGELPELCQPETGLRWALEHLKWLKGHYVCEESDLIAAYNYGHPEKTPGGLYRNQLYVDGVHRYLVELRAIA